MKKQWLAITISIATATTVLLVLFWSVQGSGSGTADPALAAPASPTVSAVHPALAPNDIDTTVVIRGTGFSTTLSGTLVIAAPTVIMGDIKLTGVNWVDTTTLSATVPWGLTPALYTLTVVNPNGISATLPNAFTVTEGLNEFVTGGPYGGISVQLAHKPDVTSTVYATMFGAGLFISEDAGETWDPIHDHDWPIHLDFDSQDTNILYYGADSNDLYRSMDNGVSWERISGEFHTQNGCFRTYPIAHPSQAGAVYFGMGGCAGINLEAGEGGVFYSNDYGANWSARNVGLTDMDVQSLAIHPNDPDTLLAGTQDGNLFYSNDGASNWTQTVQLTGTVTRLYFNPHDPLEAWAATNSPDENRGYLYRSTNLTEWTSLDVNAQPQGGSAHVQMAFLPGSVWLASQSVYSSTDSGATWTPLSGPQRSAAAIAISAHNPQEIYAGTDYGIEKSNDGGANWQEMNEGLAALVPNAVAVSPDAPETVYVKTHQGIFVSHNGGNAWQDLDYGEGGFPGGNLLAVDPFTSTRLYLGAGCPDEFCVDISPDGGSTWNMATATLPFTFAGWSSHAYAIAPSPHTPGRVLVGAFLSQPGTDDHAGVFYRSDDFGASWLAIETTQTISRVTEIAYDAFDDNLVYAATAGSGLWKSADGGDNWSHVPIPNMLPPLVIGALATHPGVSDKVYVRASSFATTPNPEPELFVSENGGASWQSLAYVFLGVDLLIAPPLPGQPFYTLYTGCEAGLCRSADDGATWTSIAGVPRPEILTSASDGERTLIYMGTPGGLATSAGTRSVLQSDSIPGRGSVLGGGVYRLTTRLPDHWVYLPFVLRGHTP